MNEHADPKPGDFMLVATPGWQAHGIRIVTRSKVNHATLLVGPGLLIEADPGGAHQSDLSWYDGMPKWWSHMDLSDRQRDEIVYHARSHIGAPYSWVDDACIAATDLLGVHVPEWVRDRLASPDRLECAQLVDVSYQEAEIHLFNDGRLSGDVAPSDLWSLTQA